MAGPRHPVSVSGAALVQTERLQTFAFSVHWSDESEAFVRRSWDEFRRLHKTLKEIFPVEAGLLRRSDRILPKLPDASALVHRGRTGRGLARLRLLETYSRALLAAGERVSRSPVLTGFFAPQPTDLEPALPPGRCLTPPHHTTDSAGRSIWRMGEARWRESQSRRPHPPSALASRVILPTLEEPLPGPTGSLAIHSLEAQSLRCLQPFSTQDVWGQPFYAGAQEALGVLLRHPSGPQFCASRAYESSQADELSVPVGARVHVLETSDRGWWLCRFQGRTGLLPAVILQPDGLGTLLSGPRLHPGADGGEDREGEARSAPKSPQAQALPPPVPAHPPLSAIRSRCCTITRKALGQDPGCQGPP